MGIIGNWNMIFLISNHRVLRPKSRGKITTRIWLSFFTSAGQGGLQVDGLVSHYGGQVVLPHVCTKFDVKF